MVVPDTAIIDAPRAQYVAIPPSMLTHPSLAPMPVPAYLDSDACLAGCYNNAQVRALIDAALDAYGRCTDKLDAIGTLSDDAVRSNRQ